MRKVRLQKLLHETAARVGREIAQNASSGGLYARGLAGEGYAGGYRDALWDVKLLLNDVQPSDRGWDWWPDITDFRA